MKKALLVSFVLAACSSTKEPVTEPTSTPPETVTPEPTTAPEVPTAAPTTEPTAEVPVSTGRPPSGRPPLTFSKPDKVTETVGASPITTFVLDSEKARFKVPEWALEEGILLTFLVDKKAPKKAKGGAGSVFRLQAQIPPAESFSPVSSAGPKFELKLPTAKVGSPNLAIGTAKKDDKGKDIVEWKVVAPTKVEGDFAIFEISEFNDSLLQITSESPTS